MVSIPPLDETLEETTSLPQNRQKRNQIKGPINSLETAIDENNYYNYVQSIPKNSTESEIDKGLYKWEKSAVIRGFPNTANTSKCLARPEKSYGDLYFDTSSYKFENQRVLRYIRPGKKVILCACN